MGTWEIITNKEPFINYDLGVGELEGGGVIIFLGIPVGGHFLGYFRGKGHYF